MRAFENRLANCAGAGFVAAVALFGYTAHANGYDPAHIRQEQVDECLPQLGFQEELDQPSIPVKCEPFADSLGHITNMGRLVYDLPSQQSFKETYTPAAHYNRDRYLAWGAAALVWGAAITGGSYWIVRDMDSKPSTDEVPEEVPAAPAAVEATEPKERKRRRKQAAAPELRPPDDLSKLELHELAMHVLPEYRAAQHRKPVTD